MTPHSPQPRSAVAVWLIMAALVMAALLGTPAAPAAAAPAAQIIIDFNGVPAGPISIRYNGHTEDGFSISQDASGQIRTGIKGSNLNNVFLYAGPSRGGGTLTITKSDATSYKFVGLDVASGNCNRGDPRIIVKGYVGGTGGTLVGTDEIQVNTYSSNFTPWLSVNLAGITVDTLTLEMTVTPSLPCQPSIDNIALDTSPQPGSIKIVKKTVGGDGTFSYSSPQLGNFRVTTQKKQAERIFANLQPGIYGVSEVPTKGWDLTNAICSDGSNPSSIDVSPGEDVTCSFTNVQRGSITVVKNSTGGDASFGFTSAALGNFNVTTVGGTAQTSFNNLVAGTYDLSENVPAGWAQIGANCSDGSTLPNVNVAAGENVTCTFANAKQGSLTVVKQATGSDTSFAFTSAVLGNFNLTTVNGAAWRTFANLNPGVYDLSETLPADWQQMSASCSDGSTLPNVDVAAGEDVTCAFVNAQLDTIVVFKLAVGGDDTFSFTSTALGNFTMTTSSGVAAQAFSGLTPGNYAVAESAAPGWNADEADPTCSNGDKASAINLGTGETVLCIFINYKPDTIVVEKRTVGGDGTFGFSSNLPGAASFALTTTNGTVSRAFTGLAPAIYSISETPQQGWAQTGVSCDKGATPDNINLATGATVHCIFTDTKLSSLIVVKQTAGGDGSFTFTGSLGSFDLTTAGSTAQRTFANILPGNYRISETVPAGWQQTGAGCTDGSNPASVNLTAGRRVTCTFANTKLGNLTVVVDAANGNGAFHFTSQTLGGFVITTTVGSGQKAFTNLAPGTYDLTEELTSGWDLGLATCSNGSNPASITVAPGETVVCTFENVDARKKIHLPIFNKQ